MEEILREMRGRSIVAVAYHEVDYEDDEPMWNRESQTFDSLDLGVALRLDNDAIVSVAWGWEFTQYNIGVHRGPGGYKTAREWDATSRWTAYLKKPIVEARLVWKPNFDGERPPEYPQSVVLRFHHGAAVVISAFESRGDDFKHAMIDHVTVFFDEAEAARFGLL